MRRPGATITGKGTLMSHGPHVIERLDDGSGPRYRLVGPGVTSKWYTGQDQLERLKDLRDLMNYAVRAILEEGRRQNEMMVNHG